MENQLENIKSLIAEDNLIEAIEKLNTIINDDSQLNELVIQSARIHELSKELRIGIISNEDASIIKNKIRSGVLELISIIKSKRNKSKNSKKKYLTYILVFSGILMSVYLLKNVLPSKSIKIENSNQQNSPAILGDDNTIIINQLSQTDIESPPEKPINIIITGKSYEVVKFSVSSQEGLHEILELYVSIDSLFKCIPGSAYNAGVYSNNYRIPLTPEIKTYRLLPSTYTNSEGSWVLKEKDIDIFTIEFRLDANLSANLIIEAKVLNHSTGKKYIATGDVFRFEDRYCNLRQPEIIEIKETNISISPYLQKLLYNVDIWHNMKKKHNDLNESAFSEISEIFKVSSVELDSIYNNIEDDNKSKEISKLINSTNEFPLPTLRGLFYVGEGLNRKMKDLN